MALGGGNRAAAGGGERMGGRVSGALPARHWRAALRRWPCLRCARAHHTTPTTPPF